MIYRVVPHHEDWKIECQEKKNTQWIQADKTGIYSKKKSAGSRMRQLRKWDAERSSCVGNQITASKQFCVI